MIRMGSSIIPFASLASIAYLVRHVLAAGAVLSLAPGAAWMSVRLVYQLLRLSRLDKGSS
jgi:hypothetical protein